LDFPRFIGELKFQRFSFFSLPSAGISSPCIIARRTSLSLASSFSHLVSSSNSHSCFLPADTFSLLLPFYTCLIHISFTSHSCSLPLFTLALFFFFFFWCLLYSKRHFLVRFSSGNLRQPSRSFAHIQDTRSANERRAFLHILAAPLFASCLDDHSRPKYYAFVLPFLLSLLFFFCYSCFSVHYIFLFPYRTSLSFRSLQSFSSKNAPAL